MKTRFILIIISLIIFSFPISTFSQENLITNLTIPGGDLDDGINPEDIIYADGKFFIAGLGTVLVIDPSNNNQIVNTITFSDRGQHICDPSPVLNHPPHSLMALDESNHKLFVLSADNEIYIINTTGNGSLEQDNIPKPASLPSFYFLRSIIRFDPVNQRLYCVINWDDQEGEKHSYIGCYNALTYDLIWDDEQIDNTIFDIVINHDLSYLYLGRVDAIQVVRSNVSTFQVVKSISTGVSHKELLYINENDLHRIYCVAYDHIYWIDGDNYGIDDSFIAPESGLRCAAYCSISNKVFFSGNNNVFAYNASNPQSILATINLGAPQYSIEDVYHMESFNNHVLACKDSEVLSINTDTYATFQSIYKKKNFFYNAAIDLTTNNVFIVNMAGSSVEIINSSCTYLTTIVTGASMYLSCYNSADNKYYFYTDEIRDDSWLAVVAYDDQNGAYLCDELIGFDENISACAYNEHADNNHILVSTYSDTDEIIKISGSNNQSSGILSLLNDYCENIFISPKPDERIYCATGMNSFASAAIEIYNANDYTREQVINLDLGTYEEDIRIQFCYDSQDDFVLFILYKRNDANTNYIRKLGRIDLSQPPASQLTLIDLTNIGNPNEIVYASVPNRVYISYDRSSDVTYYKCDDLNETLTFSDNDSYIKDIEYSTYSNELIELYFDGTCILHTCALNGPGEVHFIVLPQWVTSLKYNPWNNKIYVFSPYDLDRDHNSYLYCVDHRVSFSDIIEVPLINKDVWRYANPHKKIEMQIDPYNYKLLCPNGSHSNISIIDCPQKIPITKDFNWICFPRLYDNAYYSSTDALNDRIHPPVELSELGEMDAYVITAIPGGGHEGIIQYIQKPVDEDEWLVTGNLDYVASHKGYVLMVDWANNFRNLYLFGEILDPGYIFTDPLYQFFTNWVGYYLPNTQSPFDALATEFLDNITWMAGQNWFCHKETSPQTKSTGYSWRCACEQERLEIKYGEMIKIFPSSDIEDFYWQSPGQPPNDDLKMAAEYYTYDEQASYDPFLINLDTNDLPLEIGAFAGDSCIGATKVYENDTLVLIRGFTEGFEGEPVSFEMYYGSRKSSPGRIHDYQVSTPDIPQMQQREIIIGENQHWYDISFKDIAIKNIKTSQSWMNCSPNPVQQSCIVNYFLPEIGTIILEVMDVYGKCICILEQGTKGCGEYRTIFNPRDTGLTTGVYLVRLTGNKVLLTEKIVYLY